MTKPRYSWWLTCAVLVFAAASSNAASGEEVAEICASHKIAGGLIVHIGCGDGRAITKPWPDDIDHWTHFLHDSSGNAVSTDRRRVAPPRHLQWDGGPRWSRSHETDMSITALVSAAGRIFHTLDEGPIGIHETPLASRRFPDRCSLHSSSRPPPPGLRKRLNR